MLIVADQTQTPWTKHCGSSLYAMVGIPSRKACNLLQASMQQCQLLKCEHVH